MKARETERERMIIEEKNDWVRERKRKEIERDKVKQQIEEKGQEEKYLKWKRESERGW